MSGPVATAAGPDTFRNLVFSGEADLRNPPIVAEQDDVLAICSAARSCSKKYCDSHQTGTSCSAASAPDTRRSAACRCSRGSSVLVVLSPHGEIVRSSTGRCSAARWEVEGSAYASGAHSESFSGFTTIRAFVTNPPRTPRVTTPVMRPSRHIAKPSHVVGVLLDDVCSRIFRQGTAEEPCDLVGTKDRVACDGTTAEEISPLPIPAQPADRESACLTRLGPRAGRSAPVHRYGSSL